VIKALAEGLYHKQTSFYVDEDGFAALINCLGEGTNQEYKMSI